jgi:hypothetical protein
MTSIDFNAASSRQYEQSKFTTDKELASEVIRSACDDLSQFLTSRENERKVEKAAENNFATYLLLNAKCYDGKSFVIFPQDRQRGKLYSIGSSTKCEDLMHAFFESINEEFKKKNPTLTLSPSPYTNYYSSSFKVSWSTAPAS